MRRSLLVLLLVAAFPATATAAPVLVLGPHGRVSSHNDPFVTGPALTPAPTPAAGGASAPPESRFRSLPLTPQARAHAGTSARRYLTRTPPRKKKHKKNGPPPITFLSELTRLSRTGQLSASQASADASAYNQALATEKRLHGTRRTELTAITVNLHTIAASHQLTPSRLPALMATLAANQQWWTTGPLLAPGQRVEFQGSQLVWQYYPGQGIELQVLASFGKADGLYTAGPANYPAMEQLLSELIPLAAQRAGGIAWEYYFNFDGGSPPWTSAMSQATGLEALSRAYQATGNSSYVSEGQQALPLFTSSPPNGVGVPTSAGSRFLQYTFAPNTLIINAFLQSLIGLYDFAQATGNQTAASLFSAGNAEAEAEVPSFDTGAWSLYQPGIEDTLSYHELVTGFLSQMCSRTSAPVYCTTAQHFQTDLTTPPVLAQATTKVRNRAPFALRFTLSKYSRVGITVSRAHTLLATSAYMPYGTDSFAAPRLRTPGVYNVVLTATDLAGNYTRIAGTLTVTR